MNTFFSIDALDAAGSHAWRLLDDEKTWRTCMYAETLREHDARITDKKTTGYWAGCRLKKDKTYVLAAKQKAGTFDFLMRGIFAHAVLHRLSPAPVPDKQQMLDCIAGLEPGTPWLVYLDISGNFRAMDTRSTGIIGNPDIAVRGEIASSENYIGRKAARNTAMMHEIRLQFLAGWLEHLKSSNMSVFIPDAEKLKNESAYIEAIHNWQHE